MRHAQLRNEIERLFGVLKRRFRILLLAPEYSLDIQSRIPVALAAVHNFILYHEPLDLPEGTEDLMGERRGDHNDPDHRASSEQAEEQEQSDTADRIGDERRDQIAAEMWLDYSARRRVMGIPVAEDFDLEPVVGV